MKTPPTEDQTMDFYVEAGREQAKVYNLKEIFSNERDTFYWTSQYGPSFTIEKMTMNKVYDV
jgi:hypothetical protein